MRRGHTLAASAGDGLRAAALVLALVSLASSDCETLYGISPPEHGRVDQTAGSGQLNRTGDQATYSCAPGYALDGAAVRTCLGNGTAVDSDGLHLWSSPEPTCIGVQCDPVQTLPNGDVVANNIDAFPYRTVGRYPSELLFSCDPGYHLTGSARQTCSVHGAWDGLPVITPACPGVTCDRLDDLDNGVFEITNDRIYPASASYACNPGYEMIGLPAR